MTHIYADLYFLTNMGMNLATLWLAARVGRLPSRPWRLVAAAAIGATCSLALLVPSWHRLLSPIGKVCFSLFMVSVAFAPRGLGALARATICFVGASFLVAGGGLALAHLGGGPAETLGGVWVFAGGVRWWVLAWSIFGGSVLVGATLGEVRRRWRQGLLVPVELVFQGRSVTVEALVDTGNRLRDPLTGSPVVIAESAALAPVLPPTLRDCPASAADPGLAAVALSGTAWATRLRLVPFRSVGEPAGLMVGFRPDALIIHDRGRRLKARDSVVCVYPRPLSVAGDYRALLNPDLLEEGVKDGEET